MVMNYVRQKLRFLKNAQVLRLITVLSAIGIVGAFSVLLVGTVAPTLDNCVNSPCRKLNLILNLSFALFIVSAIAGTVATFLRLFNRVRQPLKTIFDIISLFSISMYVLAFIILALEPLVLIFLYQSETSFHSIYRILLPAAFVLLILGIIVDIAGIITHQIRTKRRKSKNDL